MIAIELEYYVFPAGRVLTTGDFRATRIRPPRRAAGPWRTPVLANATATGSGLARAHTRFRKHWPNVFDSRLTFSVGKISAAEAHETRPMDPRIHVITLAVLDLDRALEFYGDGLALDTRGVVATEFTGDESTPCEGDRDLRPG